MDTVTQVNNIESGDQYLITANQTNNETTKEFSTYLESPASLDSIFEKASQTYGVSKDLLIAVAKAESNFNPNARSYCGAMGIMQLMPATASSLGVTNAYDPEQCIMGGAKLLAAHLAKYNGNVSYALAAYNAGGGNVDKYGGIPPFKETQNYVKKILGYLNEGVSAPNTTVSSSNNASNNNSASQVVVAYESASGYKVAEKAFDDGSKFEVDTIDEFEKLFSYEQYVEFLNAYFDKISSDIITDSDFNISDLASKLTEMASSLSKVSSDNNNSTATTTDYNIPIKYNNSNLKLIT
ncbi:Transglycosylase SLT domain-containing protein [Acetitomaculum ruminis DSM 5522]|uniref:Transglycosylase SLT domain-containing protein n=1 Tax=Acetitomaculum ruminis DSM 5522 TaxID=1120918 RepID=A0A1I1AGG1_9FIRM|nr:lytic transglycosylase domain-containing protein [Acetitomaculum ruminis]SFB37089.1 Transglycosylase SLT domain-containing protein [Acetitomaculum ruminis DSM 5522]